MSTVPQVTGPVSQPPAATLADERRRSADELFAAFRAKLAAARPQEDLHLLDQAYVYARDRHGDQMRADGKSLFITHPVEVASILAEQQMDLSCMTVALLHDVLEDTTRNPAERKQVADDIRKRFGEDVVRCVDGVSKISRMELQSREDRQAESIRKMLIAMVSDIRVILVKFADRLHNIRTLAALPPEKQRRIAEETLDIYCPIAHRLGMGKVRAELEDGAFRFLDPEAFDEITAKIKHNRNASEGFLLEIKSFVEDKLKAENIGAVVQARLKRPYSIWQKMRTQRIGIEQVYDLLAIRIITESVKDCYAALGVIHSEWSPIFGRIKDFIAMPRPNLYQSLHTSVIGPRGQMFEVQIRTQEMHRIAEEGIAAHWKYKEGQRGQRPSQNDDQRVGWLRELVTWQSDVQNSGAFLDEAMRSLATAEEVFVFTPQGRVIVLPREATPVDFAYAVHSDVGNHCSGARVNGRMVPLKHTLQSGDVVEIQTLPGQNPSRDWLAFVQTSKAKSKIRHYLSVNEREKAIEVGEKLLENEARKLGVSLAKVAKSQYDVVAREYGVARFEELQSALGFGRYSARQVIAKLAPDQVVPEEDHPRPAQTKQDKPEQDAVVIVDGAADLLTFRGKCCNPIFGEPIVGYITRGRGVSVHSRSCKNVQTWTYEPDRLVQARWGGQAKSLFTVRVSIVTDDSPGLLNQFTSILADEGSNIRSLEAHSDHKSVDYGARVDMTIDVRDKKHLDKIFAAIRRVKGVRDVARMR